FRRVLFRSEALFVPRKLGEVVDIVATIDSDPVGAQDLFQTGVTVLLLQQFSFDAFGNDDGVALSQVLEHTQPPRESEMAQRPCVAAECLRHRAQETQARMASALRISGRGRSSMVSSPCRSSRPRS